MKTEHCLYETLEVSPRASAPVIKAAYRCLVQQHHPDKHAGDAAAVERLARINLAYKILSDPRQRSRYDQAAGSGEPVADRRGAGASTWPRAANSGARTAGARAFAFRPLNGGAGSR